MIEARQDVARSGTADGRGLAVEPDDASLFVGRSMTGSIWTLVSRITGLARIVVMGAVLGATYLGNTYQGLNALPNLIYYQILAGSLFVSLLVPPLIGHLREGDHRRAEALVNGFFGCVLVLGLAGTALIMLAAPLILHVFSLGVANPHLAAQERRAGLVLLLLFAPQIPLYVVAGTGAAVMNGYGRFALAAGAPTAENIGIIVTLLVTAAVYGLHATVVTVPAGELLLLGAGTTAAVGVHAGLELFGARRSLPGMHPAGGWRDEEVRKVIGRIRAVLAYTGLAALQLFAALVVANRVAGGLVAFQLALNFFYLPTAIVTWPIARALVPRLAALHQTGRLATYRDELRRAVALACFVTVPVAVAYAFAAYGIADVIAFGRLDSATATEYIAVSLIALSAAVVGETWFILGSHALYARQEVRAPFRSMAVRVGTSLVLMVPACVSHGSTVLILLGVALSGGSFAGAVHVWRSANQGLPVSGYPLARSIGRVLVGSALMLVPGALTWLVLAPSHGSKLADALRLTLALMAGAVTYVVVEGRLRAPEIGLLRGGATRIALAARRGHG